MRTRYTSKRNFIPRVSKLAAIAICLFISHTLCAQQYSRIIKPSDDSKLVVYDIQHQKYHGLDVFALDGGMSAEYAVEKSVESLSSGISHSWYVNGPGSGPNHVYATPEFLEKSVKKTVQIYNDNLGSNTVFETVIFAVGIPSMPYISNSMKAPVLPFHFLVSCNSVKAVQSIINYSNQNKYVSYATLSHDMSVPMAVAWIKLLDIPSEYIDFLKQHKVKNIVIIGGTGTNGGETRARKIMPDSRPSDITVGGTFIMYPGTSADDNVTLRAKISDIDEFAQSPIVTSITDWESGIAQLQIDNFSANIRRYTSIKNIRAVTSENLVELYDLGTYLTLMYYQKNKIKSIHGISVNPYLISYPVYEFRKGYVPLSYWQLVDAESTAKRIIKLKEALLSYAPNTDMNQLTIWINSSRNFGGLGSAQQLVNNLTSLGFEYFRLNDFDNDEVWDSADGKKASCEIRAEEIIKQFGALNFKRWNDSLKPISIVDLDNYHKKHPQVFVEVK